MQLTNSYYYFIEAIPPDVCQRIIDLGVEKIEKERSTGVNVEAYTFGNEQKSAKGPDAVSQKEMTAQDLIEKGIENTYVRDSEVTWLTDKWIYDLVLPYINQANVLAGWNWQFDYHETFQFTVYKPGGFYGWHKDGHSDQFGAFKRYIYGVTPEPVRSDGKLPNQYTTDNKMVGKVRKISLTINLNSPGDYEGGNLKFDFGQHTNRSRFHEVEEIRPRGSMVVFPSFLDHTVTPVTTGTRYSLVLWTLGDPFK
jgi:PKHD-type hydroxylase